jgi:hypothetical protein
MVQVSAILESAGIDAIELSGGTGLSLSKYSSSRLVSVNFSGVVRRKNIIY